MAEKASGILTREADGTLYFYSDKTLESAKYLFRLTEDQQPGSEEGDKLQEILNRCPPTEGILNSLRVRNLVDLSGTASPEELKQFEASASHGGTGGKEKTRIDALGALAERTEPLRTSKTWFKGRDPKPILCSLDGGAPGQIIRGADGTLYFVPAQQKSLFKLPSHQQVNLPKGSEATDEAKKLQELLDASPPLAGLKNHLQGCDLVSGTGAKEKTRIDNLTAPATSGTGTREKTKLDTLNAMAKSTDRSRTAMAWSRNDTPD